MKWNVIDTGKDHAEKNMAFDAQALNTLSQEEAILHLYDWENDAATFGHFIDPNTYFHLDAVKEQGLDLARRPTGGGIVFHISDFAFSLLVPASHPHFSLNPLCNYLYINQMVALVVKEFLGIELELLSVEDRDNRELFCMAKQTKYDLLYKGRKVGGAAQRKTRLGYLHQGSLLLGHLPQAYLSAILRENRIIEKMYNQSLPLLGDSWDQRDLTTAKMKLKTLFKEVFR